jgi:hypothetical protein
MVPWALWRRHLKVEAVTAQSVSVMRQPTLSDPTGSDTNGQSLARYTLGAFGIETLKVREGLLSVDTDFSVKGSLAMSAGNGTLAAQMTPLIADGDDITANLTWGGEGRPLIGSISAEGPADGLLARVIQARPDGAVRLEIDADGGADTWTAAASLSIGGAPYGDLSVIAEGSKTLFEATLDPRVSNYTNALSERFGGDARLRGAFNHTSRA